MCATDTGSGQRQEPGLGFNISKESVFQKKCVFMHHICTTASYMLCLMPGQFNS